MSQRHLLAGIGTSILAFAAAIPAYAQIPILDSNFHIIPQTANNCALGWGGVLQTIQNLMDAAIALGIILAILAFLYAGVLWTINAVNPAGREQGRKAIFAALIGLFLVCTSWLIVSAFMNAFYDAGPFGGTSWDAILNSEGQGPCLPDVKYVAPTIGTSEGISATAVPNLMNNQQLQAAADSTRPYRTQVCAAASAQGVPGECNQILAMLGVESTGKQGAVSGEGAVGLMQILPSTAVDLEPSLQGKSPDEVKAYLSNPQNSINLGVKYYAQLYKQFSNSQYGSPSDLAAAAYNGGPKANEPSADCGSSYTKWQCTKNPGTYVQTQAYVANVAKVKLKFTGV